MKLTEFSILLLLIHFLGDFQFQSESLSQKKITHLSSFSLHILIILLMHGFIAILTGASTFLYLSCLAGGHAVIDIVKRSLIRHKDKLVSPEHHERFETILFVADQFVHIALIFLLKPLLGIIPRPPTFLTLPVLKWSLLIALNLKPANVTFKMLFARFAPDEEKETTEKTHPGAGALIGNLERIITLLLLAVDQYAAIGLILTAKSVARYNRISESPRFAEYYLIGTLFSVLWAITTFLLLMVIF